MVQPSISWRAALVRRRIVSSTSSVISRSARLSSNASCSGPASSPSSMLMGLFCCALALCAQAVAAAFGRRVAGIATVVAYTVLGYILYGLSMTVHALSYLRPFLLWRWYLSNDPLHTGTGSSEVGVLLTVGVVAEIAGIVAFNRRDLRS